MPESIQSPYANNLRIFFSLATWLSIVLNSPIFFFFALFFHWIPIPFSLSPPVASHSYSMKHFKSCIKFGMKGTVFGAFLKATF